ncbi:MAG: hypothetical protein HY554_17430 [Elusimicrobia bacterium]|nr:hypothetical protein [Elusimicrobiota bacterium]
MLLPASVGLYAGLWLLGLAALKPAGDYLLARVCGPLVFALGLFFVEHFVGLGPSLRWAAPPLALGLGAALWRRRRETLEAVRRNYDVELALAGGFLWALSWRWCFPDLDPSSEKMTSLLLVTAYGSGTRLPPVDPWLPPEPLNFYYPLQHYAAGLAGRLLGLEAGAAVNLGFCAVIGLLAASAWGAIAARCASRAARAVCLAALFVGGTGAAVVVPFMSRSEPWPAAVARYLGEFGKSPQDPTPLGEFLAQSPRTPQLPVELVSYAVALGDFHPPLGGFALLALALYCLGILDRKEDSWAPGVALATVPVVAATNAWVAPLQLGLVAAGLGPRLWRRPDRLRRVTLWGPPLAATALVLPFLANMGSSVARNTLAWVGLADRADALSWLVVFWPLLVLLAAGLLSREPRLRSSALAWASLLAAAELVFIDDLYGFPHQRFNTHLKWMPWIFAGASLSLLPELLGRGGSAARAAAACAALLPSIYALSLGRQKAAFAKPHPGRLEGTAWLVKDPAARALLDELRRLPRGTTLEYPAAHGYSPHSALSLLSGNPTYIGWPNHEVTWRGQRTDIWTRYTEARAFYQGLLPEPADWLRRRDVRHVIWLPTDPGISGRFEALDRALAGDFEWREAFRAGSYRAGVWSRTGRPR